MQKHTTLLNSKSIPCYGGSRFDLSTKIHSPIPAMGRCRIIHQIPSITPAIRIQRCSEHAIVVGFDRIRGHQLVCRGNSGELVSEIEEEEEEDELCPVECVREFKTDEELAKVIDKSKGNGALVVVDFYRTSCGSCKYIEQGFSKLCKGSGDEGAPVIFLKHNVLDEYDEQSEVAERLRIKTVPLFHFYKNGVLVEAFPTRDKDRITQAILKYTSSSSSQQT
ncbi:Thioredoxin-like 4, chloroplastic [Linum grandiflorum]